MKDELIEAVYNSFLRLKENDGSLFDCPIEKDTGYNARKLHEVCINHKLANYLEEFIFPILKGEDEAYFVDIEFNREGLNFKKLDIKDNEKLVRPDIIIHNRKSGEEKNNFLIIECKKVGVSIQEIEKDKSKIESFLRDDKYRYKFGLQVIYGKNKIEGIIYTIEDNNITTERIEVS